MNINFFNINKQVLPFIVVLFVAYSISSIFYFLLPQKSIDIISKETSNLKYRKFNFKQLAKKEPKKKINKEMKEEASYKLLDNITLQAVYVIDKMEGWIIISDEFSKTHILSVKDIFKEYVLKKIYTKYVIFEKSNQEYKLELLVDKKTKFTVADHENTTKNIDDENIVVQDDKISIKRGYLNSYMNNIDKIWKDISIKDIKNKDGSIGGFKVYRVKKNSAFSRLGLQKGDIIKSVNNRKLKSYNDAFSIYKTINKISDLNMEILRNNTSMELNYEIQ